MESLKEMMQQCSKETLEEAMGNMCELLQVVAQGISPQVPILMGVEWSSALCQWTPIDASVARSPPMVLL
jgi:hypothetical protein